MSLTSEAVAAHAAEKTADATAAENDRKALRAAAADALRTVLTRPDGTVLTMAAASLSVAWTDLANGVVVVSDATVALTAQQRDGQWSVRLAEQVDGQWTPMSEPLLSLADLGAALEDA